MAIIVLSIYVHNLFKWLLSCKWNYYVFLGASLIAQLVKIPPAMQRPWFNSWGGKICWKRVRLPTPGFLGFSGGSAGKKSACNPGYLDLISGLGRFPGKGKGYPLQYSGLENSMDWSPWGRKESDMTEWLSLGTMKIFTEIPRELWTKKLWEPLVKANHVKTVSCFFSFLVSRGDHMTQFWPKQKFAGR